MLYQVNRSTELRNVLINIGYNDIKHGISVEAFEALYKRLITTCYNRDMRPLISLIQPREAVDCKLLQPYNAFLMRQYRNIINVSTPDDLVNDLMMLAAR